MDKTMTCNHPYTSTTTHWGDMRCHTTYTDKGAESSTDIPEALGGRGEYPSPAEMLAACVASCMLSNIAYTGRNKGFETTGISVRAHACEEGGKITALRFEVNVPMPTTPETRRFMEAAVATCPVGRTISESVPKHVTWRREEER